ncbi:DUF255 domain-containing protein [Sulfurimonas sp.]|uniref:DUF255 domain-containing protein n=1 Tax=Sulfurimonas sp. TaxID=2022749 RepID=UPI00261A1E20|nr:DUF255 domain-containing protein [Sulfurimonas sp.]
MKNLFFVLLFFTVSLFSGEITYSDTYVEALKKAKKEHKLVYIIIVSDNCKWCKKFEKTTLQEKEIKERVNKEFVTVLLSRDKTTIPPIFKTTSSVPRHYFVDTDGNVLYWAIGYRDKELINAFMDNAQLKLKQLQEYK